jgi:hypothetical protein
MDHRVGDRVHVFVGSSQFEQPPRPGRRCRAEVTGRLLDANGVSVGRGFHAPLSPTGSYIFNVTPTRSGRCHVEVRIDLLEQDIHLEREWHTSQTIRLADFQALEL